MFPDQYRCKLLVKMKRMGCGLNEIVGELMDKPPIIEMMSASVEVKWLDGPWKGCVSYEWCHHLDILSPEEEAMYCLAQLGGD
jgi:hypothetical protein